MRMFKPVAGQARWPHPIAAFRCTEGVQFDPKGDKAAKAAKGQGAGIGEVAQAKLFIETVNHLPRSQNELEMAKVLKIDALEPARGRYFDKMTSSKFQEYKQNGVLIDDKIKSQIKGQLEVIWNSWRQQ